MQRFIPLLPAFPPGAFFADLFELFPSGGIARVDFEHSIELQFRFGQGAFRHSLLGSAQSLRNVVGAFEGGLHLAKNFPCRLVSRIELQRGFRLRLGILDLSIRKKLPRVLHARLHLGNDLLAPNFRIDLFQQAFRLCVGGIDLDNLADLRFGILQVA